jgi:hypothetical protein
LYLDWVTFKGGGNNSFTLGYIKTDDMLFQLFGQN